MNSNDNKDYIESAKEVLKENPYTVFIFSGTLLLLSSIAHNGYAFKQIAIFFVYSVAGLLWRYAEKDIRSANKKILKENNVLREDNIAKVEYYSRVKYHTINFLLLIIFLICIFFLR